MKEPSNKTFGVLLGAVLLLQLLAGFWHLGDAFIDGRYMYNWGPPFWLIHAQETNEIGLLGTYFGVANYSAHPHLIAPVIALWTSVVGYSEFSIRLLSLLLTILATFLLVRAIRTFLGNGRALAFGLIFASLPLIYIYGKKLDQEALMLVFLALQLWGTGLIEKSKKVALTFIFLGSLGMMLSDWSGVVFSVSLSIAALVAWGWKERRKQIIEYATVAISGSILGLVVFFVQTYLRTAEATFASVSHGFVSLWVDKAGTAAETFSWVTWVGHEVSYLQSNFSIPLACVATASLVWVLIKNRTELSIFALSILLGSVAFLIAVPQTSGMHVYFQYYLAIPVALGLVYSVDIVTEKFFARNTKAAWLLLVGILFVLTSSLTIYQYNKLFTFYTWGDTSDVELLKSIKEFPPETTVVAAEQDPVLVLWFQNPNIEYYAGRAIPAYVLEAGVPAAEYQIVPSRFANEIQSYITSGAGYGKKVTSDKETCSKNYCLLHLRSSAK